MAASVVAIWLRLAPTENPIPCSPCRSLSCLRLRRPTLRAILRRRFSKTPDLNGPNFRPVVYEDAKGEMRQSYEMGCMASEARVLL